jgi:hypothetical protein
VGDGALPGGEKIFQDLKNKGWRELPKGLTHGLMEGVLFDKETADGITTIMRLMNEERQWRPFTRKLARITAPIKWTLTQPNPGFHIRNAIGDSLINEIDSVAVKDYAQAWAVLSKATEKYGGESPLIMAEGDILEQAFKLKDQEVLFHTRKALKKPGGLNSSAVTHAELYAGLNKYGITQNYARVEFSTPDSFGSKIGQSWPVRKLMLVLNFRENYFRAAHFIKLVKQNPTGAGTLDEAMSYAAARVRKMHFDYTDFTKWEKQVASNVIPFYKWTRKAVPLMAELMFTNPGKVIAPNKAQMAISRLLGNEDPNANDPFPDAQGLIPKWMIDAGYSPGGQLGGNNSMFAVPNPFQDVITNTIQPLAKGFTSGPRQALNSVLQQSNPLIKNPYELTQNENTFMSGDERVPVYKSDSKKKDLANYFMNQIPYAHQISRAQNPDADKANLGGLVSQLTGIYAQELTPSMQRGEMFRQNKAAQKEYADLKKKVSKDLEAQGIKPPKTVAEWEDFLQEYTKGQYTKPKRGA